MQFMGISIIVYALVLALATFIENDFGTDVAKSLVYNTWYIELLYLMIGINLIANIRRFKLYKKEKWTIGLFHISFIIILLGAGTTRYFGFEGNMHIREGNTSNTISTIDPFIKINIEDAGINTYDDKKMLVKYSGLPGFKRNYDLSEGELSIKLQETIKNAEYQLINSLDGKAIIDFITIGKNSNTGMNYSQIIIGENQIVDGYQFDFQSGIKDADLMFSYTDSLRLKTKFPISLTDMMGNNTIDITENVWHTVHKQKLYNINGTKLVIKQFYKSAKYVYTKGVNKNNFDVFIFNISKGDSTKELIVRGNKYYIADPSSLIFGKTKINIAFGPKRLKLPFSIRLNEFKLERYPGSMSPSSFRSEVSLIDEQMNINEEKSIYMNNILKHRGYRFFQSSYDTDEKGTVLSVNNDLWGMRISYLGYFLMMFGMFSSLFPSSTRFKKNSKKSNTNTGANTLKTLALLVLLSTTSLIVNAQGHENMPVVSKKQAALFGRLLVQDNGGRIEPINTLSSELIRKITKKSSVQSYNSDQILLSMLVYPVQYKRLNLIKVANKRLAKELNCTNKYAKFSQFFDNTRTYLLADAVRVAHSQKDSERSKYYKEVIAVDERVNIYYMITNGDALKLFPDINDDMKPWNSPTSKLNFSGTDSLFVKKAVSILTSSIAAGNTRMANDILGGISKFQSRYGGNHIPSIEHQEVELIYNKYNIFKKLFPIYLLLGFILLILLIVNIVKENMKLVWPLRIIVALLIIAFTLHTINLGARWYICGHAPWSNGFESMTYVAWASLLAGFLFSKKSYFSLAAAALIAGLTLFVAHLSWMSPEVTNLVPVLKSYWLTIHVAVITASYGFLALACILGFINMFLYILLNKENKIRLVENITKLTQLSEMTMTIGIYCLASGTMLGGIWANESWGRYWGWDPKETWALISVLVYSFVLHMRFIPKLKSTFSFNVASILAYSSILMTYFGVNYYLSGMHSYAQGDSVPFPTWALYAIIFVFVLLFLAYFRKKRNTNS